MNIHRIEILLEKYFEGETSREEEKKLKDFFRNEEVPKHLHSLKELFQYLDESSKTEELDEDFDDQFFQKIDLSEKSRISTYRRIYFYVASGVAASILIVFGLFRLIGPGFSDEEINKAYSQTKDALIFVSEKLNSGLDPARKVSKFDEGLKEAEKITAYNKGIEEVKKVSKVYEAPAKYFNK